jgi:hypothetical protein
MNEIKRVRFEALAAYCRLPGALYAADEVRWFEAHDEQILIVVIHDHTDGDYSAMLFARDLKERYRWIEMTAFFSTAEEALAAAPAHIARVYADLEAERAQGDEKGRPVDFFTPVVSPAKLNPNFTKITAEEGFSPALELIKPMMRWYEDADGNFVEQFQTTGFDNRLWELYLFAALVEVGYTFDKEFAMPDFCARSLVGELCIEATTVNPSRDAAGELVPPPPRDTPEQVKAFLTQYMPIRYAGPLTAKLKKKYWEKEHVKELPLVFAIQDLHAPNSMNSTWSALPTYLYGIEWEGTKTPEGELVITSRKIEEHVWGPKTVPSGFFFLPGSEHVSAVISNVSANIMKFDRMGVLAGFGSKRVRLVRRGKASNPDPNAMQYAVFVHDVNAPDYEESWIEGMDVFHNPNALHPLHPMMLPGATHHRLIEDGQVESLSPPWQPFGSTTEIEIRD